MYYEFVLQLKKKNNIKFETTAYQQIQINSSQRLPHVSQPAFVHPFLAYSWKLGFGFNIYYNSYT